LSELKQSALEHGAVESFLRGDLVWDFGDVKGVTTPGNKASGGKNGGKGGGGNSTGGTGGGGGKDQVFAGVDLKKVGKDGIVAPPLPPPGSSNNGLTMNGSKKLNSNSNSANINGNINGKNRNASANGGQVNGSVNGTVRDKKEKVLEGLRDDKLALRLARSLFK